MASPPPLVPLPPLLRVRERGVASEVWMQHGEGELLPVSCGEPLAGDAPEMALGIQVGEEEWRREPLVSNITATSQPGVPTPASSFSKCTTQSSDLSGPPPTMTPPVRPPTLVRVAPARR